MKNLPDAVVRIAEDIEASGGRVQEIGGPLPDGSGFMTASFPLPKDHWLYDPASPVPPMPWRTGLGLKRAEMASQITAAARYAIRASTMSGQDNDFDPDALARNFVVGMLGYFTEDGLSSDDWANPSVEP